MIVPSKEHLSVNLSSSADTLLRVIVDICSESDTPVISVSQHSGERNNSFFFIVNSVNTNNSKTTPNLFGLPLRELELFDFIIPLSKTTFHVTPLAFKRAEYKGASFLKRFLMKTTSVQALLAALIGMVTLVFGVLSFIFNLLNSLIQLLENFS